jgi:hypothetical protein
MGIFVGFLRIFLLEFLIYKGLTARRLYKSFGVKGIMQEDTFMHFFNTFHCAVKVCEYGTAPLCFIK